jgi:hypothetical protein
MGQSKSQKAFNQQMATNAQQQYQLQREMFDETKKETPEQQRFRQGAASWDTFVKGKNYGTPPDSSVLNFDLMTPAMINKQTERMRNITGVGAAAMGGTGDQSIALQQTREHNANELAQQSGNAYEQALKQEDAYYKGNGLAWAGLDINKNMGLLNNATSSGQYFFDQQRQTLPPSFMQTFAPLIGGALGAAGSILGPGFSQGGAFNRRT